MYFITNKEDLIIAASSEFMSKVGSRDVCSLSNMLSDKLINLKDDNELSISNADIDFSYTKTTIHSAFGDLELYRLLEKNRQTIEAEDDENIAYLKKIKEGTIVKEDNEYSVPNIPTLDEDNSIKIEDNKKDESIDDKSSLDSKEYDILETVTNTINNKADNDKDVNSEEININIPEIPKEAIEESFNVIKKETDNITKEIEPTLKELNLENNIDKKESLKEIEVDTQNKEIKESITKEIEPTLKDIKLDIDKELKDDIVDEGLIKEIKEIKLDNDIKEEFKLEVKNEDVENTVNDVINKENVNKTIEPAIQEIKLDTIDEEEVESEIKKETKRGLFSNNLFPWGKRKAKKSKKSETSNSDLDSILNKEIAAFKKSSKENIDKNVDSIEENLKETKDKVLEDSDFLTIFKDDNKDEKSIDNTIEIKEPSNDTKVKTQEPSIVEQERESVEEFVNNLEIKESIDNSKVDKELSKDTKEKSIEKVEEKTKDIEPLIEIYKTVEEKPEETKELKTTTTLKEESIKSTSSKDEILEKIIKVQVNAVNLEDNAKKLNIDLNSYKMLLKSYLDEIDKFLPKLEESNKQTIDMLTDAGQLLSLSTITSKLSNLISQDSDSKVSIIKEIELFTKLLKDKMDGKEVAAKETNIETNKTNKEELEKQNENISNQAKPKMVIIDNIYSQQEQKDSNDKDIEITSTSELLERVKPEILNIDPKIAAEELNLPEDLIIEFINDFLIQSKEHLPILVESYLNKKIDKVQATAHMLKGAANNLRLNKIADNLFRIQKETKLENDTELIKKFVAHIKGLEIELKNMGE